MQSRLKSCVFLSGLILGVLFCVKSNATTSNERTDTQLKAQIQKITVETQQLENEVHTLQAELYQRKRTRRVRHARKVKHTKIQVAHTQFFPPPYHLIWSRFRHPITVTTSPFMGIRSAYDASDLLQQQSTMNEDLTLLQQRAQLEKELDAEGYPIQRPILEISGGLEGQVIYSNGFGGVSSSVNLSTAELDLNAVVNSWVGGLISLDYDDSPAVTGSRVPNSRIYLRRGFITIGNLIQCPWYFTTGQFYMPFGRYSSALVTAPLTLSMARVVARGLLLGFYQHGFYGQLYGFEGEQTSTKGFFVKQGGVNLGYKNNHVDAGTGIISNIADAEGMQNNSLNSTVNFNGFGEPTVIGVVNVPNFNNLRHRVPAADVHSEITIGPWTIIGEFISAVRRFSPLDMTFNRRAALPRSLHTELDYLFHVGIHPVTLGIAYGRTWQALALNLPQQSIWTLVSTSIWKDTIESIEFRHDINYSRGTIANGGTTPAGLSPVAVRGGGSRDSVTGQIGVYF